MKLAKKEDLYPYRTIAHKYMSPKDSCEVCHGIGWLDMKDVNNCCECAAGERRKELVKELIKT